MDLSSGKGAWKLILVGSVIVLLAVVGDLLYHNSIGEMQVAIGKTPLEMTLHSTPVVITIIFLVISVWQIVRK